MGFLRDKLEEVGGEVESFINKVEDEVNATIAELDSFGPDVFIEIRKIRPELDGAREKLNGQIDGLLSRLESMKQ